LVMSGLLRVVIDADGQDCCHGEVSFIESYREGMAHRSLWVGRRRGLRSGRKVGLQAHRGR
jgi:hypothetical protein